MDFIKIIYHDYNKENEKLAPIVREIGWTQHCLIWEKCKDEYLPEEYAKSLPSEEEIIKRVANSSFLSDDDTI